MPTPLPVLIAAGLFAGVATGVAVEAAGFSPIPEPEVEVGVDVEPVDVLGPAVAVHDCPDGAAIALLAVGDGVLATGRTDDGLWIEIRSPLDTSTAAWMSAGTLDPDGDLDGLPVHGCGVDATTTTTTGSTTTTSSTSTTSTSSTTSTTTTAQGATTVPSRTTTTRPAPPPITTTTAVPDLPPTVGQPTSNQPLIETRTGAGAVPCPVSPTPETALITVSASDDRGNPVVTMTWRSLAPDNTVRGGGSLIVQGPIGNVYTATLGPLPQSAGAPAVGANATIEITVLAVDSAGHQTQVVRNVLGLRRCP